MYKRQSKEKTTEKHYKEQNAPLIKERATKMYFNAYITDYSCTVYTRHM